MRRQFKDTILDLAEKDERIALIFGDVSVYLFREFSERWPERFYNMGICENTLVSAAAGMASQGMVPFVHTIAPFLTERSYEQIKLDLCYNRFPANIVTCGASFDYAWDGATHHCYTDLAILRLLPGMEVLCPGSRAELDTLLRSRYASGSPTYFRLSDHPHQLELPVEFGKAAVIRSEGAALTVMTAGPLLGEVLPACEGLPVNLVYFHTLKPIDRLAVSAFAGTRILVVQDAHGLYEAINEVPGLSCARHGLPDRFLDCYGRIGDIRASLGLDAAGVRRRVQEELAAIEKGGRR